MRKRPALSKPTTIRLEPELNRLLDVAAAVEYRSISALLNLAAREWLQAHGYFKKDKDGTRGWGPR